MKKKLQNFFFDACKLFFKLLLIRCLCSIVVHRALSFWQWSHKSKKIGSVQWSLLKSIDSVKHVWLQKQRQPINWISSSPNYPEKPPSKLRWRLGFDYRIFSIQMISSSSGYSVEVVGKNQIRYFRFLANPEMLWSNPFAMICGRSQSNCCKKATINRTR